MIIDTVDGYVYDASFGLEVKFMDKRVKVET